MGDGRIDFGESVQLGFHVLKILRIKVHLQLLTAVQSVSRALADDLGGVDNVLQIKSDHFNKQQQYYVLPKELRGQR